MENAYKSVLEPILYELRDHLSSFVIIGGWVPELYRRFGEGGLVKRYNQSLARPGDSQRFKNLIRWNL